jgi:copper transport outer membrane protein MctB
VISWRYHLVSIVAVFLALGLGVLAGTTVLDQGLVNSLRDRTERLQADLGDLRTTVDDLQTRLGTMNAFAEEALPYLVGSRLAGRQVVIVTQDGIDGETLDSTQSALDLAGGEVLTTLSVSPEMAAGAAGSQEDLADILGVSETTPPEDLASRAAARLAERLADEPRPLGEPGVPDFLGELLSQGFVTASRPALSDATLQEIGGRGQLVVVLGGGPADAAPVPSTFMVPLVRTLVAFGVTTAAGESLTSEAGFVPAVRSDVDAESEPLVTVDTADLTVGGAAIVLGLQRIASGEIGGDYGVGPGASGLLPAPA